MTETNHRRKQPKKNQTRLIDGARDNVLKSRVHAQSRAKWKKVAVKSARQKDKYHIAEKEERVRKGVGPRSGRPKK